jgi:GPH family glycoside/pentoside/hexuronide:cation symporter
VPPASRIAGGALAAYGALGLPLASAALPVYVHLPNLYGGLLGMNLALLGSLLLAARLLDALVDPLIGVLNDRLQRPRLLVGIGALLLAIGMLLVLNPPQASTSLGAWLMLALIPVYLGFSLASVSYHAWGALLGDDSHERTRVTASREAFGLAGVVAASVLPTLLAPSLDAGLARFAWLLAAVTALATGLTLARAPRPPQLFQPAHGVARFRLGTITAPLANAAFRPLYAVFVLNGIASALPATLVLFFITDALALPRHAGLFLAAYFLSGALSLPLWVALSRRIGKPRAWFGAMLASIVAFVGAFVLGPGDALAFGAICVLSGLALGADLALPPALLADVIRDHGEERRAGSYFGLWNFAVKLNLALAAGLALPLLAWLGYQPGAAPTVAPLYYVYCLVPCALKLAAAALLWREFGRSPEVCHA